MMMTGKNFQTWQQNFWQDHGVIYILKYVKKKKTVKQTFTAKNVLQFFCSNKSKTDPFILVCKNLAKFGLFSVLSHNLKDK